MRVISRKMLKDYWERDPSLAFTEGPLSAWFKVVKESKWGNPMDIKATFGNASILKSGRAVFNVAGNKIRVVAEINYGAKIVFLKFVGNHEEYDAIDADTVDQTK